ncbi:MAG: helix-turn-helix domain-containing protein, partial [Anaerovoracaceae bacterium]
MLEPIIYKENLFVQGQLLEIKQYPLHYHKDIQLIYVLEGEIELKLAYAFYTLKPGDLHFIHSLDIHGIRSISKNNRILFLNINSAHYQQLFPNFDSQIFTIRVEQTAHGEKIKEELTEVIVNISAELGDEQPSNKKVEVQTIKLINLLYQNFRQFTINKTQGFFNHKTAHDENHLELICRIVALVYDNYPYKLSLTEIAKNEHINAYYLSHLFQHFAGESFRGFLSMVRVEMSERFLLDSTLSISQISSEVGFSNPKYYVDNFKVWFGCHPKEYRKRFSGQTLG